MIDINNKINSNQESNASLQTVLFLLTAIEGLLTTIFTALIPGESSSSLSGDLLVQHQLNIGCITLFLFVLLFTPIVVWTDYFTYFQRHSLAAIWICVTGIQFPGLIYCMQIRKSGGFLFIEKSDLFPLSFIAR